jgi:hypothetical protein
LTLPCLQAGGFSALGIRTEKRKGGIEFEKFVHYRFFSSPSENGEREGY